LTVGFTTQKRDLPTNFPVKIVGATNFPEADPSGSNQLPTRMRPTTKVKVRMLDRGGSHQNFTESYLPFTCRSRCVACTNIVKTAVRCSVSCWMYVAARIRIPPSPPASQSTGFTKYFATVCPTET